MAITIVFVHGWSVTNTNTYGSLPIRLRNEAEAAGIGIDVKEIYLGKYISFHDEVRLRDISKAFEFAVNTQLDDEARHKRFICITHSTGGPVIRDWWARYHTGNGSICPVSHLIMLAPANYGSALAQLGKGKISRLKSWFEGVEPGQGVLDWLELGSAESWELNKWWLKNGSVYIGNNGVLPFVIAGQAIDRKFYDNLNTYTGELGSDGVVRTAAANLKGRYLLLQQAVPDSVNSGAINKLEVKEYNEGPATPLRVVTRTSHSNANMGIMSSVSPNVDTDGVGPVNAGGRETVAAIMDCIKVTSQADYDAVFNKFVAETSTVQQNELIETETTLFPSPRYFFHDRFSMVVFKVVDTDGRAVTDYDLILTAGADSDPNHLTPGFFADRQQNRVNPETITYFFNYDVMVGCPEIKDPSDNNKTLRPKIEGMTSLGLKINPRPEDGFIRYMPCEISATPELFTTAIQPNSTTLVEICLQRLVNKEIFNLETFTGNTPPNSNFSKIRPGGWVLE